MTRELENLKIKESPGKGDFKMRQRKLKIFLFFIIFGVAKIFAKQKFWGYVIIISLFLFLPSTDWAEESLNFSQNFPRLSIIQENTLIANSPHFTSSEEKKILRVVVTAYSSTPWQTDNDPYITASGSQVKEGIIANNLLPFGTKVKIPELFGEKIFVVEDRMNQKKGYYHVDVWFPSYWEAKNFGVKRTYIEILDS